MTTEGTDLYAALGLRPRATDEQIRRAYRAMMRHHHPDTRPAADGDGRLRSDRALEAAMAAYAVLGDPLRRAEYDHRSTPVPRKRVHPARTGWLFTTGRAPRPPISAGPVRWYPVDSVGR
jgi:curved DNA-binding protein CbpA